MRIKKCEGLSIIKDKEKVMYLTEPNIVYLEKCILDEIEKENNGYKLIGNIDMTSILMVSSNDLTDDYILHLPTTELDKLYDLLEISFMYKDNVIYLSDVVGSNEANLLADFYMRNRKYKIKDNECIFKYNLDYRLLELKLEHNTSWVQIMFTIIGIVSLVGAIVLLLINNNHQSSKEIILLSEVRGALLSLTLLCMFLISLLSKLNKDKVNKNIKHYMISEVNMEDIKILCDKSIE